MKFIQDKADQIVKKYLPELLKTPYFSPYFTESQKEKFVKIGLTINSLLINIASLIVLYWLFTNKIYNAVGFEKTVLILLVLIGFLLRKTTEKLT